MNTTVIPQRDDDSSVNAVIAFAKKFSMIPLWSIDAPKNADVLAVHAYLWPATQQTVVFLRWGAFAPGSMEWRGGWEILIPPTPSLTIADTEAAMRRASAPAALELLREALDAWPQCDPASERFEQEMPGADVVEWFGQWAEKVRKLFVGAGT